MLDNLIILYNLEVYLKFSRWGGTRKKGKGREEGRMYRQIFWAKNKRRRKKDTDRKHTTEKKGVGYAVVQCHYHD